MREDIDKRPDTQLYDEFSREGVAVEQPGSFKIFKLATLKLAQTQD